MELRVGLTRMVHTTTVELRASSDTHSCNDGFVDELIACSVCSSSAE